MIRRYIPYQQKIISNKTPKLILMDVSWIDYEHDNSHWFYTKYPPRAILETVTSVPTQEDYDPVFWSEVEGRLTDQELQAIDLYVIEILVQTIIESFYRRLDTFMADNVDRFIFHRWIDQNTIALIRSDLSGSLKGLHARGF